MGNDGHPEQYCNYVAHDNDIFHGVKGKLQEVWVTTLMG